ncbi:hypothetical protein GCM10007981_17360 [Thermocladium modestius]|uniref:DUF488 domain-containing protein n=1 Tax=Thermocladium modestius TaxID=62609 RepID=A0A830GXC3_9CREN|nr:DUF488 family protein [Thermocladium modestius]GGP22211.1 hypothetical protein GCM10007981_17360 [Thermocladium modestius]
MLKVKRVYDAVEEEDGLRILVDALWPRGIKGEKARIDVWLKEIAPSGELRRWFNHEPSRWEEFKSRYWRELDSKREAVDRLISLAKGNKVTLLYSARDRERNNAVALLEYLRSKGVV